MLFVRFGEREQLCFFVLKNTGVHAPNYTHFPSAKGSNICRLIPPRSISRTVQSPGDKLSLIAVSSFLLLSVSASDGITPDSSVCCSIAHMLLIPTCAVSQKVYLRLYICNAVENSGKCMPLEMQCIVSPRAVKCLPSAHDLMLPRLIIPPYTLDYLPPKQKNS